MRERRYEFSAETKRNAWARCGGRCEHCGNEIRAGNGPDYHHRYKPATEPGSNDLDNCQVLCARPCHRSITDTETTPRRAKAKRIANKRIGAKQKRRGFQGWRRFDGSIVWQKK